MTYDISIKTVALAGATGELGSVVLKELLKSGLFEITVLTRDPSTHAFPTDVKVARVDYESLESLATALTGQDALVSTLASLAIANQKLLIDAAVRAGVKRIIPSEFSCDLYNPKTRSLPIFAAKVKIEQYLAELAQKGLISYTLVFNGPFLDWGLRNGMFFNFEERSAELYDGGEALFSTTRLATAGKAVRRILTHPRETADRAVWIKDIDITQKQLVNLAKSLTPGEEWMIKEIRTADLEQASNEEFKRNESSPLTMLGFLRRGIFGKDCNGHFEKVHNQVFGIKPMTELDVKELLAGIFRVGKSE